jgi:hypothetical protein
VFTARYALMPYVKQVCLVFKGLNDLYFQIFLFPTDFLPEAILSLTVLTAHIFKFNTTLLWILFYLQKTEYTASSRE